MKRGKGGRLPNVCRRGSSGGFETGGRTFQQAASVPVAAITALQGLRDKGKVQAGQKVLINGDRGRRYVRCSNSEIVRRNCDWRMQHEERGHGPLNRRRSRH